MMKKEMMMMMKEMMMMMRMLPMSQTSQSSSKGYFGYCAESRIIVLSSNPRLENTLRK